MIHGQNLLLAEDLQDGFVCTQETVDFRVKYQSQWTEKEYDLTPVEFISN